MLTMQINHAKRVADSFGVTLKYSVAEGIDPEEARPAVAQPSFSPQRDEEDIAIFSSKGPCIIIGDFNTTEN